MIGRGNPCTSSAIKARCCVFFIAPTSLHHLLARDFSRVTRNSMVAQAGQTLCLAGSDDAGISTPVWAIAKECGNSCDRSHNHHRSQPCTNHNLPHLKLTFHTPASAAEHLKPSFHFLITSYRNAPLSMGSYPISRLPYRTYSLSY